MALQSNPFIHVTPSNLLDSVRRIATTVNGVFRGGAHGTLWEDGLGSINSARVAGANVPTWSTFRDGINAYAFSASQLNEAWMTSHITHSYKPGTKIWPHVHWSPGNSTNTGTVRWGLEYTLAKGYSQEAFPASTTIYVEQAASGTAYMHQIAEVVAGQAIGPTEVDSLIMFRFFRDGAHANDTFTGTAFAFFMDMHFEMDRLGTPQRNWPFYTGLT